MSACLFTVHNEWWNKQSIAEIEKNRDHWQKTCDEFLNSDGENLNNRFYQDQYSGYMTNLERCIFYLMGFRRKTSEQ